VQLRFPIESIVRLRKIIHLDMDCFYAAIELRERPELKGHPVAVGGGSRRGVVTTCNYEARRFGVRSAMPGFKARELCPELVFLPVRFDLYRTESAKIRKILLSYTPLVEPLSLDEAYLDVTGLTLRLGHRQRASSPHPRSYESYVLRRHSTEQNARKDRERLAETGRTIRRSAGRGGGIHE
jgi:nucleotidyltransferase/DNA polymerase involved in DNA repair